MALLSTCNAREDSRYSGRLQLVLCLSKGHVITNYMHLDQCGVWVN